MFLRNSNSQHHKWMIRIGFPVNDKKSRSFLLHIIRVYLHAEHCEPSASFWSNVSCFAFVSENVPVYWFTGLRGRTLLLTSHVIFFTKVYTFLTFKMCRCNADEAKSYAHWWQRSHRFHWQRNNVWYYSIGILNTTARSFWNHPKTRRILMRRRIIDEAMTRSRCAKNRQVQPWSTGHVSSDWACDIDWTLPEQRDSLLRVPNNNIFTPPPPIIHTPWFQSSNVFMLRYIPDGDCLSSRRCVSNDFLSLSKNISNNLSLLWKDPLIV